MAPHQSPADCLGGRRGFSRAALLGLATLGADAAVPDDLTLPLELSRWMRIGGIGVEEATDALLRVRHLVLAVAGLDAAIEPVPLLAGDGGTALLSLGVYLVGLLGRATCGGDWSSPEELALLVADLAECHEEYDEYDEYGGCDEYQAADGRGDEAAALPRHAEAHPKPRLSLV